MTTRFRTALLFGMPGVGKGTQGRLIASIPGYHHMASGDMFRSLDNRSELGRKVASYSSRGLLVPDDLTVTLWCSFMQSRRDSGAYDPERDLLVLDGIPRSIQQVKAMEAHIDVLSVLHIAVADEESLIRRIQRRAQEEGRHDDADQVVIRRRFEVYREETLPVLHEYPTDIVADIDAVGSPAEVLLRILQVLVPARQAHFGNPFDANGRG